jgi:protein-S-isoprenylcysteine O-methyltransferase Ste14
MQAPSLPEGNVLSRTARRYHAWHVEKPIRPQTRRFIYRMLVAGLTLVVTGLVLVVVAVVFSADIEADVRSELLKAGTSLAFIGISTFAMGHAYRRRGIDVQVSQERRSELASLVILSEACALGGILIGLWSGMLI